MASEHERPAWSANPTPVEAAHAALRSDFARLVEERNVLNTFTQMIAKATRVGECMSCTNRLGALYVKPDPEPDCCPDCGEELYGEPSGADAIEWFESHIEGARLALVRAAAGDPPPPATGIGFCQPCQINRHGGCMGVPTYCECPNEQHLNRTAEVNGSMGETGIARLDRMVDQFLDDKREHMSSPGHGSYASDGRATADVQHRFNIDKASAQWRVDRWIAKEAKSQS